MRIRVVCTVAAFGLVACHGTTSYVSGGGLAGVRGLPDSAPCNDVEQQGTQVDLVASPIAAPRPVGGTIEDGTYVLTRSTLHTRDASPGTKLVTFGKITMVVNGTTSQLVKTAADGVVSRTTTKRESSSTVTISRTTCSSPKASDGETASTEFTAAGGTLQFIAPGPAGTVVATYVKLPN
jgi:hypothetical protein